MGAAGYSNGEGGIMISPRAIELGFTDRTVHHEVGHHVLANILDRKTQGYWGALWVTTKKDMPNQYAKTTREEGFAESYAAYHGKDRATLKPSVKAWFDKYIGGK